MGFTSITHLIWQKNFDFAYELAKINKLTVNARILNYLVAQENLDEVILKFAKLNPPALTPSADFKDKPMLHAIKLGKTDLADKLIDILDEYNTHQAEHVDL